MTTLAYLRDAVIPAAALLLPELMRSSQATAMLLAIALQESGALHRQQVHGPARGFWQFELNGIISVCLHPATQPHLMPALATLRYPFDVKTPEGGMDLNALKATVNALHQAVEHNDVLACIFARLNLWWLRDPLPERCHPDDGYRQYLDSWRPGKPKEKTWAANFQTAWDAIPLPVPLDG